MSIDVDPKRAEPNATVSFKIHASPKSYVGLLAVDQSVLLLKSGNDITVDMVRLNNKQIFIHYDQLLFRLKMTLLSTVRAVVIILVQFHLEEEKEQFAFGAVGGLEEKMPTQFLKYTIVLTSTFSH